jgi:hypothetical protein
LWRLRKAPLAAGRRSPKRDAPWLALSSSLRHPVRQRGLSQFNCLRQARISGAEPEVAFRPTQRDQSYRPATCLPAAWLLVLLIFAISLGAPAQVERRVALVIGNSAYKSVPRLNDATLVGGMLKKAALRRCRYQARSERATARLVRADMRWRREYPGVR